MPNFFSNAPIILSNDDCMASIASIICAICAFICSFIWVICVESAAVLSAWGGVICWVGFGWSFVLPDMALVYRQAYQKDRFVRCLPNGTRLARVYVRTGLERCTIRCWCRLCVLLNGGSTGSIYRMNDRNRSVAAICHGMEYDVVIIYVW